MDLCSLHCLVACGLILGVVVHMGFPWLVRAFVNGSLFVGWCLLPCNVLYLYRADAPILSF